MSFAANVANSLLVNCVLLSEMIVHGTPKQANMLLRQVTVLAAFASFIGTASVHLDCVFIITSTFQTTGPVK